MYFLIFLCVFFSQTHAADDSREVDTFNFVGNHENDLNAYAPIRVFMEKKGFQNEYQHFLDLIKNKDLSGSEKLEKDRVFTKSKYFQGLAKKDQEEKNEFLGSLLWVETDSSYCYRRLLFAACVYVKADANYQGGCGSCTTLIAEALMYNDMPLARIALDHGADLNKSINKSISNTGLGIRLSVFTYCSSLGAAKLMIERGADVCRAYKEGNDFVSSQCVLEEDEGLLGLYLKYIKLDESNQNGQNWMQTLSSGRPANDNTVSFLRVLLENGCDYTEDIKNKICKRRGKQEELKMEFKRHENPDIKPAKR